MSTSTPTYQEAWQLEPGKNLVAVTHIKVTLTFDSENQLWDGCARIYCGDTEVDTKVFNTGSRRIADIDEAIDWVIGFIIKNNNLQRVWRGLTA